MRALCDVFVTGSVMEVSSNVCLRGLVLLGVVDEQNTIDEDYFTGCKG